VAPVEAEAAPIVEAPDPVAMSEVEIQTPAQPVERKKWAPKPASAEPPKSADNSAVHVAPLETEAPKRKVWAPKKAASPESLPLASAPEVKPEEPPAAVARKAWNPKAKQ